MDAKDCQLMEQYERFPLSTTSSVMTTTSLCTAPEPCENKRPLVVALGIRDLELNSRNERDNMAWD
jgi:hypothetical protein